MAAASNSHCIIDLRGTIDGGSLARGVLLSKGRLREFRENPMIVLICSLLLASVLVLSLMGRPDSL